MSKRTVGPASKDLKVDEILHDFLTLTPERIPPISLQLLKTMLLADSQPVPLRVLDRKGQVSRGYVHKQIYDVREILDQRFGEGEGKQLIVRCNDGYLLRSAEFCSRIRERLRLPPRDVLLEGGHTVTAAEALLPDLRKIVDEGGTVSLHVSAFDYQEAARFAATELQGVDGFSITLRDPELWPGFAAIYQRNPPKTFLFLAKRKKRGRPRKSPLRAIPSSSEAEVFSHRKNIERPGDGIFQVSREFNHDAASRLLKKMVDEYTRTLSRKPMATVAANRKSLSA